MNPSRWLTLSPLAAGNDAAFLALRVSIGSFLVWGVWDNITSPDHMAVFVRFLAAHGFPAPHVLAPFDVWLQFAIGVAFILGLGTRWAGLLCAANFIVAIVMVDHLQGWRGSFGSMCLVAIGLVLATHGPGRYALDRLVRPAAG
jgi:putative oxidoreductase